MVYKQRVLSSLGDIKLEFNKFIVTTESIRTLTWSITQTHTHRDTIKRFNDAWPDLTWDCDVTRDWALVSRA